MSAIYILRHGEAGPGHPTLPDSSRTLTQRGFADIRKLAARLRERAPDVERILFSPYVRARQTAALVNDVLNTDIELLQDLVPDGNPEKVIDRLAGLENEVLLVSHMPLVNDLTKKLTGQSIAFHQGTCIKIQRPNPVAKDGALAWSLDP